MRIWLVRHGETDSNAGGVFQGHTDVPLNAKGVTQALETGRALRDIEFDTVYASDLSRAARTAELIAGDRDVVLDRDLREMHYGILQGVRYVDAEATLQPHGLAEAWRSGDFRRRGLAPPGGESLRMLRARSRRFSRRIEREHAEHDCDVLVVAHGGKLASLLTVLLGLPTHARHSFRFGNCGVSRVTFVRGRGALDFHNMLLWEAEGESASLGQRDRGPWRGE